MKPTSRFFCLVISLILIISITGFVSCTSPNSSKSTTKSSNNENSIVDYKIDSGYKYYSKDITKNLDYPEAAIRNNIQGTVEIMVLLDSNGIVKETKIKSTPSEVLTKAAIKALENLVFEPIEKNLPNETWITIPYTFGIR